MKTLRKLTALSAVLCLLCALWAPIGVTAEEIATPATATAQKDILYTAGELLETLDNGAALRYYYDRCIDGILAGEEEFQIPNDTYTISEEEAEIVSTVIDAAIPESYGDNIGHSYGSLYIFDDYVLYSAWFYDWGLNETQAALTEQRVEEMTAGLEGKSDYEKSYILYERLILRNIYDYGTYHQTAYGPLVEGMSVCAGYARAYQMLLHKVGIPCLYIIGTANGGDHAWNIVQLDGEWYYSDPTWDDDDDGVVGHQYFNQTYAILHQDHTPGSIYDTWIPRSTATEHNYFYKNGLVFTSAFSEAEIQRLTELMRKTGTAQILLSDVAYDPNHTGLGDLYNTLFDVLYDVSDRLGLFGSSCSIRSNGNGTTFTLRITRHHDHIYHTQVIVPTCVTGGFTIYSCQQCAENHTDDHTDPMGHEMVSYPAQTPTCTTPGWEAYEMCVRCGHSTQEIVWGECQYEVAEIVYPDCYNYGYTIYACIHCGYNYYDDYIEPLGHTIGDGWWYNEWYHGRACIRCDYIESMTWHDSYGSCDTCGYGKEPEIIPGDVNGDGKLNNRDLGLLQQYLNGWSVTVVTEACDLYEDGKLNNRDLGLLQRLLNK